MRGEDRPRRDVPNKGCQFSVGKATREVCTSRFQQESSDVTTLLSPQRFEALAGAAVHLAGGERGCGKGCWAAVAMN